MAKIARFNGNVRAFASNQQSGERRVFGATTPVESDLLSDQLTPEFLRGWGTVGASEFPPIEWFNALGFTVTEFIAYLHQSGIPEWNSLQEYHSNSIVSHNGFIYVSISNDNVGNNPASDSGSNWTGYVGTQTKYSFETISDVDGSEFLKVGDTVSVENYSVAAQSGILFFKVVPSGTGIDDGGKYIDLPTLGLQLEQNLKKPYNASSWGQVGDGVTDDTAAINAALDYARISGRLVINGTSLMTAPLAFASADRGMFIEGDGSQSYGEFNTGKPSTLLFGGLATGQFCITLDNIFPFRIDGLNIESDNWDVNGIKTTAPTRELIFNDVSIKGVSIGIETHDTFVVRGTNLGITARSKGISWGGGTTLQLENLKLQGDKIGGVRLDRGIEFAFDAAEGDSPVMPNVHISGFCQYSNTVVYTDNSSCQVELDSFDVEDNDFAILWLKNQYKGSYRIRNSAMLINDGSNIVVAGEGNQYVTVDIDNPLMKDKHMITKDWTTEKFINTETSNIGSNIEFVLDERTFNRVKTGISDTAMPRVKVTRSPFVQDPDCILQIGSGTMPEDYVNRLWKNKQLYDNANNQTIYYGTKSSEFSNGMIYKITSQDTVANTPLMAYFTMRTVDGSQYFNLTDVIGTMPLTYDAVNDELVFTAAAATQRFVITCG